jgi:capsular exopolysaccharide synthesis family protein
MGAPPARRRLAPAGLLAVLRRNRALIAATLLLALAAGLAVVKGAPPRFRATATLRIDQHPARVLGTEESAPDGEAGAETDRALQTEADMLGSRALAERVARRMRLLADPGFPAAMGATLPATPPAARWDALVSILGDHLTVTVPRNSRVVQLAFDAREPAAAAALANGFALGFIDYNLARRMAASRYSLAFLGARLDEAKARLESSQRALTGYARRAGLVDASAAAPAPAGGEAPRSLTAAAMVDLNQAHDAAAAGRLAAEERWRAAEGAPLLSVPEVLGDPAIQSLARRRAELAAELDRLNERLAPEHPLVRQQQAEIDGLDRQIRALGAEQVAALDRRFRAAAGEEAALGARLAGLKGAVLDEQDRGVRYATLAREVEINRQLFDALLARFRQVSAEAGSSADNVSVVDMAAPPLRPVWPRPVPVMATALFAGLGLAALLLFGRERWWRDAVRSPGEVERKLGLPLLEAVPLVRSGGGLVAELDDPLSPTAEVFQAIRAALELATDKGRPRTLLVTSSGPGEGKTTAALALARALDRDGRVLLVDADLRKPALHHYLECGNARGLSCLLGGQGEVADAVQRTAHPGLDFLAAGPSAPNPGQLLAGAALPLLLAELGTRYDLVILDGPPVLARADAPRLARAAAATLFVVEANRAGSDGVRLALARLAQARATVAGAILTKFDAAAVTARTLTR